MARALPRARATSPIVRVAAPPINPASMPSPIVPVGIAPDSGKIGGRSSTSHGVLGRLAMNTLKGHLLIATPRLNAPVFVRSVILMLDHGEDGAMGLILNHP